MPESTPRAGFIPRAAAFTLLAVATNLWMSHHLGFGWSDPAPLVLLSASVTAALGLLDRLLLESEKSFLSEGAVRAARGLLSTPALVVLYGAALLAGMTWSSIRIITPPGTAGHVEIRPLDGSMVARAESEPDERVVRLPARTTPFGKLYEVSVDGYLAETMNVPPLFGLSIVPEEHLRRAPSVLFRPPFVAMRELVDGGRIVVFEVLPEGRNEIASHAGVEASFLVGRDIPIPHSFRETWDLELQVRGLVGAPRARIFLAWSRPVALNPARPLAPGATLQAEVLTRGGEVIASGTVTLPADELIDAPLEPTLIDAPREPV